MEYLYDQLDWESERLSSAVASLHYCCSASRGCVRVEDTSFSFVTGQFQAIERKIIEVHADMVVAGGKERRVSIVGHRHKL